MRYCEKTKAYIRCNEGDKLMKLKTKMLKNLI